ncbi:MAG: hypothetical protein SOY06_03770 [Prevotella sp.]|nr:hypothetical protein [Bacteroidales bacterium]MDY4228947.1 hypothetical protein [Prevotella sp.]
MSVEVSCLELRLTRWWSGGLLSLHFQLVAGGKQEENQSVGNILMFFAAYYLVKKKKGITFASVICHGEASLPPQTWKRKPKTST